MNRRVFLLGLGAVAGAVIVPELEQPLVRRVYSFAGGWALPEDFVELLSGVIVPLQKHASWRPYAYEPRPGMLSNKGARVDLEPGVERDFSNGRAITSILTSPVMSRIGEEPPVIVEYRATTLEESPQILRIRAGGVDTWYRREDGMVTDTNYREGNDRPIVALMTPNNPFWAKTLVMPADAGYGDGWRAPRPQRVELRGSVRA